MYKLERLSQTLNIRAELNPEQARVLYLRVILDNIEANKKICVGVIVKDKNKVIALKSRKILSPKYIDKNYCLVEKFKVIFPSDVTKSTILVVESEAHYL